MMERRHFLSLLLAPFAVRFRRLPPSAPATFDGASLFRVPTGYHEAHPLTADSLKAAINEFAIYNDSRFKFGHNLEYGKGDPS